MALVTKSVTKTQTTDEIVDILCNKCGKTCGYTNKDGSVESGSFEGLIETTIEFGYWSTVFGDQYRSTFSICESCLMEYVKSFKIPIYNSNAEFLALPPGVVRTNGGVQCDMMIGPCACGAWHTEEENAGKV